MSARHPDLFANRHIGPDDSSISEMLNLLGLNSLDGLVEKTVPEQIRTKRPLTLPAARGEYELLGELRRIAAQNKVFRSFIGMGYYDCITPPVIQRNILENPGWYTAYTPYQAEISQGRMEALINFQQLVTDLTGLDIANASLLDEATACAEAMAMARAAHKGSGNAVFVSERLHPQNIAVIRTRAEALGIEVIEGDEATFDFTSPERSFSFAERKVFAVIVQYPDTTGIIRDFGTFFSKAKAEGATCIVSADLLALCLLRPPADFG